MGSLSEVQFVSGADEKLVRVFDAPRRFVEALWNKSQLGTTGHAGTEDTSLPVLGLSNKASNMSPEDLEFLEQLPATGAGSGIPGSANISTAGTPPLEDELARQTLWPEHEKLYGHGYEISCLAISKSGSLVATACKASSLGHAVIRMYERKSWRALDPPLSGHSLTVTGMAFSDDDEYLLSVGRDRQWTVFKQALSNPSGYVTSQSNPKSHSRMILGCAWAPSKYGRVFGTAGRDKLCKLWSFGDGEATSRATVASDGPVTGIDFCSKSADDCMMALGTEGGVVTVHVIDMISIQETGSFKFEGR